MQISRRDEAVRGECERTTIKARLHSLQHPQGDIGRWNKGDKQPNNTVHGANITKPGREALPPGQCPPVYPA